MDLDLNPKPHLALSNPTYTYVVIPGNPYVYLHMPMTFDCVHGLLLCGTWTLRERGTEWGTFRQVVFRSIALFTPQMPSGLPIEGSYKPYARVPTPPKMS